LLFFHGSGDDLSTVQNLLKTWRDKLCIHIIAAEYPGYGLSKGKPSSTSINAVASKMLEFITNSLMCPCNQIIVCGQSLGTGPATKVASEHEVGALLLISPFTSIKEVARNLLGWGASVLVASRWKNMEAISKVKCPTLFCHGKNDRLISRRHSVSLYRNCSQTGERKDLCIMEGVGHNDIKQRVLIHSIREFLRKFVFVSRILPKAFNLRINNRVLEQEFVFDLPKAGSNKIPKFQ